MRRGIRSVMPRVKAGSAAAATAGVLIALTLAPSACKKTENAATDTTAMATTPDTTTQMAPAPSATPATTPAPMTDAQIFARLAAANEEEVAGGKMAQTKATNADVKAFARMMVVDHTKLLNDGNALAKRLKITPDTAAADSIRNAAKSMSDMLKSAPKGATFDTAYVNGEVTGHQNTLDMLKSAADQAQNADLKKAINGAIPTVQMHLDRIKNIQGKMK